MHCHLLSLRASPGCGWLAPVAVSFAVCLSLSLSLRALAVAHNGCKQQAWTEPKENCLTQEGRE
jgi:hypothetical protein